MLQGRPVVGRDVYEQLLVVGVSASNIAPCGSSRRRILLVQAFGAWFGKASHLSGHGEATVVVALELLGGDFARKVEYVAKVVKKIHAMQAIMK